jgi:peptidoglycan/LPS O-acetylase OafA/YrhL
MKKRLFTNAASGSRHIPGLDLLRFFAALVVMMFHLAYLDWALPGSTAFRLSGGDVRFPELVDIAGAGWIGVQIFFVISGFVIAYSAENASLFSFVRSRMLRLVPAAWICATLSFIALSLLSTSPSNSTLGRSLLLSPWGPWVDPSYWTLGVEIVFYALVALLIAGGRFTAMRSYAMLLGLVSAVYWLAWWVSLVEPAGQLHQWMTRYRDSRLLELLLVPYGCFFALGVMLWSQFIKQRTRGGWPMLTFLATVCLMQIAAHHVMAIEKIGIATSVWVPMLAWSLAIVWMALSIHYSDRLLAGAATRSLLRRIGLMTYPLYLIHQVLGCLLLGALDRAGIDRFAALGITVAVLLALSNLVCSVLEQPLRSALKRGFSMVDQNVYS